jgi:hypothetical protein
VRRGLVGNGVGKVGMICLSIVMWSMFLELRISNTGLPVSVKLSFICCFCSVSS